MSVSLTRATVLPPVPYRSTSPIRKRARLGTGSPRERKAGALAGSAPAHLISSSFFVTVGPLSASFFITLQLKVHGP